jgi:hypothetical protein
MTAGLHMRVDIIQMNNAADDNIGGAVITGTTVYSSLPAVLTPRRPSQAALEAGLETDTIYDFSCKATKNRARVVIDERDQILVVFPTTHELFNKRLRVLGVQPPRGRVGYGTLHATCSRIIQSRTETMR